MISITRLNDTELVVNSDMIEFVEATPDTILTLTDGKKVIVKESPSEIVDLIIEFRNRVMAPLAGKTEES